MAFHKVDLNTSDLNLQQAWRRAMSSIDAGLGAAAGTVKVSAADTTANFLGLKLTAGTDISLTPQNLGLNETLQISSTYVNPYTLKVTTNDTSPSFLATKLVAGTPNVSFAVLNPGVNERLAISCIDTTAFGGDLTEPAPAWQTVTSIRCMPSPDPTVAEPGFHVTVGADPRMVTPNSLVSDGTYLYVGQTGNCLAGGSPVVWKLEPSATCPSLTFVDSLDISATLATVASVYDLADDGTYLFAACGAASNIVAIDMLTMNIAGWAYGGLGTSLTSVCTDGTSLYALDSLTDDVHRWLIADILGSPPDTQIPNATYASPTPVNCVRYGAGFLWLTSGAVNVGLNKVDPATMTSSGTALPGDHTTCAYVALGSVWVTSVTNQCLYRMDPVALGAPLATVALSEASAADSKVTLGPDGLLYVTFADGGVIIAVNPTVGFEVEEYTVSPVLQSAYYGGIVTLDTRLYAASFCDTTTDWRGIAWIEPGTPVTYGVGTSAQVYAPPWGAPTAGSLFLAVNSVEVAELRGSADGQALRWNNGTGTWGVADASPVYLPLVSGLQYTTTTNWERLGVLHATDFADYGSGTSTCTFKAVLAVPLNSTVEIRLDDYTNVANLYTSPAPVAGDQTNYEVSASITPAAGSSMLEVWMRTTDNTGGQATLLSAGILVE